MLKGVPLALHAYGDLAVRGAKDIDLLISLDDLPAATALLERAAMARLAIPPTRRSCAGACGSAERIELVHSKTRIPVDLHWQLLVNPHLLSDRKATFETTTISLPGGGSVRALRDDDLFVYLCAHGACHAWFRLKWLADIGALLAERRRRDDPALRKGSRQGRGTRRRPGYAPLSAPLCHALAASAAGAPEAQPVSCPVLNLGRDKMNDPRGDADDGASRSSVRNNANRANEFPVWPRLAVPLARLRLPPLTSEERP